ncbi:MAG: hypothetical protein E7381_04985 [Clostridiales bacterium]|nr:hypothetical protein [Clostridiales bacterium]
MTTPNTPSVVYDTVPEGYPPHKNKKTQQPQPVPHKKKKNVCARLFAVVLLALCALLLLFPVKMMKGTEVVSLSFWDALSDLFSSKANNLFGILPSYADTVKLSGKFIGCAFYVTLVTLAVSAVFSLITVFCSKKAPCMLRFASFFFTLGVATHVAVTFVSAYVANRSLTFDILSCVLLLVGALVYFVLAVAKNGKTAWMNLLTWLFTAITAFALVVAILQNRNGFRKGLEPFSLNNYTGVVTLSIFFVFLVSILESTVRLQTKKGLVLDLVCYIVQFIVGVLVCYLFIASKTEKKLSLILSIVATVVALIQIVICIVRKKIAKEKYETEIERIEINAMKEAKEAKTQATLSQTAETTLMMTDGFVVEEYAEALPYQGAKVDSVTVAEEVNPTFTPSAPQVQTAGYDFYNCKSFDPFIATLDSTQRNQFTEIFILKYAGIMPEIPNYEVGGDNKDFFRKLFIYLGQYRDRIPDGLLAKIYQFAIKLN